MKAAAFLVALLATTMLHAQPALPDKAASVLGDWWTPGFGARVHIEACGDALCGRIVWAWDETPKDIVDKNPLVGRKVVEGMRADGAGRWTGGRLYNPEDGRDYTGLLHLQSPSRLSVEGCFLFICKQQIWRRADMARCPPVEREPGHQSQGFSSATPIGAKSATLRVTTLSP